MKQSRNNGRAISERLVLLRDYLYANADRTHAVSMEDIQKESANLLPFRILTKTCGEVEWDHRSILFSFFDACHCFPFRKHLNGSITGNAAISCGKNAENSSF